MKFIQISLILLIAFASVACGSKSSNPAIESDNGTTVEVENESETADSRNPSQEEELTIGMGTVGPFSIKAAFPGEGSYMGYDLVRKEERRQSEVGFYTVITYDCMKDGETPIVLYPNIESDLSETGIIDELRVYSALYKTDAGIGVGNTIEEFYLNYADAKAHYSFLNEAYWLEMEETYHTEFRMKKGDYSEEPSYDSDLTVLDRNKFKKGAKIEYIRLY